MRAKVGEARDLAATSFLEMLIRLRTVLIQDVACMRHLCPTHPLFNHPLFASSAFLAYEEQMQDHLSTVSNPRELQLQLAMPSLMAHLTAEFAAQRQQDAELTARLAQLEIAGTKAAERTHNLLLDMLSGNVPFRIMADLSSTQLASSDGPSATAASSASTSATTGNPAASSSAASSSAARFPGFRMSRTITTVEQVFREWKELSLIHI